MKNKKKNIIFVLIFSLLIFNNLLKNYAKGKLYDISNNYGDTFDENLMLDDKTTNLFKSDLLKYEKDGFEEQIVKDFDVLKIKNNKMIIETTIPLGLDSSLLHKLSIGDVISFDLSGDDVKYKNIKSFRLVEKHKYEIARDKNGVPLNYKFNKQFKKNDIFLNVEVDDDSMIYKFYDDNGISDTYYYIIENKSDNFFEMVFSIGIDETYADEAYKSYFKIKDSKENYRMKVKFLVDYDDNIEFEYIGNVHNHKIIKSMDQLYNSQYIIKKISYKNNKITKIYYDSVLTAGVGIYYERTIN